MAAVGPTALALQYASVSSLIFLFFFSWPLLTYEVAKGAIISLLLGRYPDYLKLIMWFGLGVCTICLFLSSFVSSVSLFHCESITALRIPNDLIGLIAHPIPWYWPGYRRWSALLACHGPYDRMVCQASRLGRRYHICRVWNRW